MLLLIDIGNTRIKWAVPQAAAQIDTDRRQISWAYLDVVTHENVASLENMWHTLPITEVIISNVASEALYKEVCAVLIDTLGHTLPIQRFVAQNNYAGITNHYQHPEKLGSDRFAALIGVHQMFPDQNVLLATCGTATTIDTLTAEGHFVGGVIVPGLGTMASSLAIKTAQLPHVENMTQTITVTADNTVDAIVSGCVMAQIGAFMQIYEQQRAKFGQITSVLAGGAAAALSPYLPVPHTIIEQPVLTGLYVSHLKNNV